jgi:hypothetical protein
MMRRGGFDGIWQSIPVLAQCGAVKLWRGARKGTRTTASRSDTPK